MKDIIYIIEERIGGKWVRWDRSETWPLAFVSLKFAKNEAEYNFGKTIPYRIVRIEKTFTRKVVK